MNLLFVESLKFLVSLSYSYLESILTVDSGNPVKFSDTSPCVRLAPPLLGEHTERTLEELGFSKEEVEKMKRKGIL